MTTKKPTKRGRYEISPDWTRVETAPIADIFGTVGTRTTELADLVDTRGGYTYRDGARRVTLRVGRTTRTRTFIGESAWSEARRWADDTESALLSARRGH